MIDRNAVKRWTLKNHWNVKNWPVDSCRLRTDEKRRWDARRTGLVSLSRDKNKTMTDSSVHKSYRYSVKLSRSIWKLSGSLRRRFHSDKAWTWGILKLLVSSETPLHNPSVLSIWPVWIDRREHWEWPRGQLLFGQFTAVLLLRFPRIHSILPLTKVTGQIRIGAIRFAR